MIPSTALGAIRSRILHFSGNFSQKSYTPFKLRIRFASMTSPEEKVKPKESQFLFQPDPTFSFNDYDCISFDLDNTLVRYKFHNTVKLTYDALAKYMIDEKGYSDIFLDQDVDYNFTTPGLIIDDENGNLLKLSNKGKILRASHGTKVLMNTEILEHYSRRRWDITDKFIKDPLLTWHGHYWQRMYPLLDIFDIPAALIFARCVDSIDDNDEPLSDYKILPDIMEAFHHAFDTDKFHSEDSYFYQQIKENPSQYYRQCSNEVLDWLSNLKKEGKQLFLITSSSEPFAKHTAKVAIGKDWEEFFDLVICDARKPGFFTLTRPFMSSDSKSKSQLGVSKINHQGNFSVLLDYVKSRVKNKRNPKFVYVGDNILHDIYAPDILTECDTVFVCPDLETEGFLGHKRIEGEDNVFSFVWGSFFFDGNELTQWGQILKKHPQLCIPNLDYVASRPVNHVYDKKHINLQNDQFGFDSV